MRTRHSVLASAIAVWLLSCNLGCTAAPDDSRESAAGVRVDLDSAQRLVRAFVFEECPDMNPLVEVPLDELTTEEMWERLEVQLFSVTDGVRAGNSYLVHEGRVLALCGGLGGHGIQSACVTDFDADGVPELTYTWSWGSGIHRTHVGICRLDGSALIQEEVPVVYRGDLFVRQISSSRVAVEIGDYDWEFGKWHPVAALGELTVAPDGGLLRPEISLVELAPEHRRALWRPSDEG